MKTALFLIQKQPGTLQKYIFKTRDSKNENSSQTFSLEAHPSRISKNIHKNSPPIFRSSIFRTQLDHFTIGKKQFSIKPMHLNLVHKFWLIWKYIYTSTEKRTEDNRNQLFLIFHRTEKMEKKSEKIRKLKN